MKTIHKHRLDLNAEIQEIKMSELAKPLRVDYMVHEDAIQMWVEVDADIVIDAPTETRRFKVFLTGDGIPDHAHYVGTTVNHLKPDAYHVFELLD